MLTHPAVQKQQHTTEIKRIAVFFEFACLSFLAVVGLGLLPKIQAAEKSISARQVSTAPTKTLPQLVANYGKLPISFEANQGQVSGPVQYLSRGPGYTLFLTGDGAVLTFGKAAGVVPAVDGLKSGSGASDDKPGIDHSILRMKFIGASVRAAATGADELPGKSNYFIGNDPTKWRTNVPNYAKVRYLNAYPGVDLVYYGTQGGQLEYDFVIAPGGDPHSIGLKFEGPGKIRIEKGTGDLILALAGSELRFRKPVVYQDQFPVDSSQLTAQDEKRNTEDNPKSIIQNRKFLDGRFVLSGKDQIGFQVAAYDHRSPLVIDPVLVYSSFLGRGQYTVGYRVAVDASGSAYVAGATNSTDFPTTAGVFKSSMNPGGCAININPGQPKKVFTCPDAFVTKLDPTGTQLVYSTYLGGSASDGATGISVDSSGNVYVTGATGSRDFPTTAGAFQTSATDSSWRTHAFATKLNPTGSALIYSTYLAGTHDDFSTISALDSSGYLYVAGGTISKDFPTTAGAFQRTISGTSCHNYEQTWPCFDGFIAKLNLTGSGLIYSTYLGGSNHDVVLGLAVDSTGSAYVTGGTASNNFPTANALQSSSGTAPCGSTPGGNPRPCFFHAFVTKLNSTGTALDYSTYLGGNGHDGGVGIAVDDTGAAYVTGATNSTNFPTTAGAAQTSLGGGTCGKQPSNTFDCPDAFVAKLEPAGTSLAYSSYLGGNSFEFAMGIALDTAGNAYVVGATDSLDFPTDANTGNFQGGTCSIPTTGIFQTSNDISGYSFNCPNAFLTEIDPTGSSLLFSTYLGGASGDMAFGVAVDAAGDAYVAGSTLSSNFPVSAGAFQTSMTGYTDAFISKFTSPSTLSLSASSLTFATQVVGMASAAQPVTLSNTGNRTLTILDITTNGAFSQTNTCGSTVSSGASCIISVTFKPVGSGTSTGTLSIWDNASSIPQTVLLTGTGIIFTSGPRPPIVTRPPSHPAPGEPEPIVSPVPPITEPVPTPTPAPLPTPGGAPTVSLAPASLAFAAQVVGTRSSAQVVTLVNTGNAPLTLTGIATSANFAQTNNCGSSVAAKGTCTISVTFLPTAAVSLSGALTITDNSSGVTGSKQTVALSGIGEVSVLH
jgi:hypothetical protein